MPIETVARGSGGLAGPAFDRHGVLHVCCTQSGAVCKVVDGKLLEAWHTSGQPAAIAFHPTTHRLHVADLGHRALLQEGDEASQFALGELVTAVEGRVLVGPTSLAFLPNGTLIFTDSGFLGEATLARPIASLYSIPSRGLPVVPVLERSLAHASGLAVSPNGKAIFVCETLQNRILRLVQRPAGVWHASAFAAFSGGLGPVACACDKDGALFVARYDFRENAAEGVISIIAPNGRPHAELVVPGAEVTGLCFDPEGRFLYITEASTNTVYRYDTQHSSVCSLE